MRVAFLCINYAPSVGGAQELVRRIGEGLVGAGHEVRVVTTDTMLAPSSPDAGRLPVGVEVRAGVEVHRLPVARRSQDVLRAGRSLGARLGRTIRPTVLAYGPWGRRLWNAALDAAGWADVVVATSAPFTTILAAVRAGRRTATPVVSVPLLHLDDWTPGRSVLEPLRNSARAVALTSSEHDWMVRAGVDGRRCVVLPPGVDRVPGVPPPPDAAAARARLGIDDRPTVAVIGRIAATKGIDTLLAAAPEILRACPEAQFLVAGRRTGWSGLDELVAAAPPEVADRVVVRRDFDDDERGDLFAAADVVAFPSREESFGLVVLEAWASGRPVVAAAGPAVSSVVRDGVDGRLVAVDDPAALAAAVGGYLARPEDAASAGRAGAERTLAEFSWDVVIDRWTDLLGDVLSERTAAGTGVG